MKTAKRKLKRDQPASPIRAGLIATMKEIEGAAALLGYDTGKPNWRKHLRAEGRVGCIHARSMRTISTS
jgi:hypothetical protein